MLKRESIWMRFFFYSLLTVAALSGCSHSCVRPGDFRSSVEKVADSAVYLTRMTGGATLRLNGADLSGKHLYAVAVYPEEEERVDGLPNAAEVSGYIHDHLDLLAEPKNSFGAWYDKDSNETYFDVSAVVQSEADAEELARWHHQKAFYDLFRGQEIRIERLDQ